MQARTERRLPAIVANGIGFLDQIPGDAQDQGPGQLNGRRPKVTGVRDLDAEVGGRLHVNRRVAAPGRGDELQVREAFENGARQGTCARA